MNRLDSSIKWIMLAAGIVTCTTFAATIAPQAALSAMFGTHLTEPLADLIVRSWGLLVFLMGALLIYGAFNEPSRRLCIITVGASKIGFLALILLFGKQYLETLWTTVLFDSMAVIVLGAYLFAGSKKAAGPVA